MLGLPRCNSVFVCSLKIQFAAMFAALLCVFALCPASLHAQSASTGIVAGQVTDPSDSAIVGATVTLTDKSTNLARTVLTNDVGRYIFVDVAPGVYTISVNKTGFRVTRIAEQQVQVGLTATVNVKLEIGSVAETVEVTASGADL